MQQYTGDAYTADETEFNVFNTDQKLVAIEGLANVLASIPGRKALVEFTGGITQTGEENRAELQAATDAANRADISIYSIDARGMYTTPPGATRQPRRPAAPPCLAAHRYFIRRTSERIRATRLQRFQRILAAAHFSISAT